VGTKSQHKDPTTGKILIVEEEGNRETRFSPQADCAAFNDWTQVYSTDVGEFIEGQLEVSVSVRGHASAQWSAFEIRVIGFIGPVPNVCAYWMLGGNKTTGRLPLEQGDTYDRIAVEARPIVNGTPGPGALQPLQASVSVALKLWS
jgi:hypothetical protein